ncbi:cytochrome P450 [Kibdelosporangium banguiense]|uniref:Cytochrome P450 n=1 Tax=Kibdelosporangium banguiense TaxID=1365924 RepID=A0ABS4TQI2_9PSEU|nr:cytochrome P450 [Kibdelosporangium banguiense]MBP2326667.1 cytochrome P450 [Kibdelosporangium banguiense]
MLANKTDIFAALADPETQGTGLWQLCSWLRENDPVHRTERGVVMVSRYHDTVRLLTDPTVRAPEPEQFERMYQGVISDRARTMVTSSFPTTNPPRQTFLRKVASKGFNQRVVRALQQSTTQKCTALLTTLAERLRDGETVDLQTGFLEPLALDVIGTLLGVPADDWAWLARLVPQTVVLANPAASKEQLAEADRVTHTIVDYIEELTTRRTPGDDLISVWTAESRANPTEFSTDDLIAMIRPIWLGGFETTATAIGDGILNMIEHPHEAPRLTGDAAQAGKFIDESLRHGSPVLLTGALRLAGAPITLDDGTVIPTGTRLSALIGSANHDPAVYPDPEKFDPDRTNPPSLAFGRGIHNCIGQVLARMELHTALPQIHQRLPHLTLAEEPKRRGGLPFRSFARLAVTHPQ